MMELLLEVVRHVTGMAWKIAWGLVLGFGISAVVQVFVRSEAVAEHLGEARPGPLALATGFGAASSSCSYAAAAMSKTLFQKGAHLANATAFLFASTNLVIEIGLVIWMLLGWRFVAAEVVGGVLLIGLAALLLPRLIPDAWVEGARRHLEEAGEGDGGGGHGDERLPWSRLATREGLERVGRTFHMDWSMVGRDIALGVAIAGSLAALVPQEAWQALFLLDATGEPLSFATLVHVLVGPLIAIVSFVCSVGNIPLAAVLWENGISFAGVIAFIFADLVTIPMVLVYRRYYGWRFALAFSAGLLLVMVASALAVETLFHGVGLAPEAAGRAGSLEKDYFAWDYTAWLNMVFLPLGIALFALGRRASGGDGGHG